MVRKAIDKIIDRPVFATILLEVLILLAVLVCPRLAPKTEFSFGREELAGNATQEMWLKKGSYLVEVHYTPAESNGLYHFANLYMADNDYDTGIRCDEEQVLNLNKTEFSTLIWAVKDIEQFKFYVDETYTGELLSFSVKRIFGDVNERALLLLVLFAAADYLLLCFVRVARGKDEYIIKYKVFLALAATSVLLALPLFINYLLWGHDLPFHIVRIEGIRQSILDGAFPARINRFAVSGQGYADPIFYPYLFIYIPAILRCLGLSAMSAYKIFTGCVIFFGVFISYHSFYGILKNRKAALIGMFLFNVAPYHLANLYSRAAVGENLAYSFIPLVAWGAYLLLDKEIDRKKLMHGGLLLVAGFTGIIQSHILSCEIVGTFLLLGLVICIKRFFRLKTVITFLVAGLATVLLNVWFLLPFVQSYGMDYNVFKTYSFWPHCHSLTLYQIFGARQQLFGSSVPTAGGISDEMGISIGLALSVGIIILLYEAINVYRNRDKGENGARIMLPFAIMAVVALWMCSDVFPWFAVEKIPFIGNLFIMVQFPWRNLGVATFCLSIVVAALFTFDYNKEKFRVYEGILLTAALILCLANFESLISKTDTYEVYSSMSSATLSNEEYFYGDTGKYDLYMGYGYADKDYEKEGGRYYYTVDNVSESPMEINTHLAYYPYYVARDTYTKERVDAYSNKYGCLAFSVPGGYAGEVCVSVPESKKWLLGDFISLITAAVLIFAVINELRRKKIERSN